MNGYRLRADFAPRTCSEEAASRIARQGAAPHEQRRGAQEGKHERQQLHVQLIQERHPARARASRAGASGARDEGSCGQPPPPRAGAGERGHSAPCAQCQWQPRRHGHQRSKWHPRGAAAQSVAPTTGAGTHLGCMPVLAPGSASATRAAAPFAMSSCRAVGLEGRGCASSYYFF